MLESLWTCTPDEAYELILSDDASDAETAIYLASIGHRARVYRNNENRGFAAACNVGAALARGEYLIFLNSDLEFRPGWLKPMLAAAERDSKVGAVGARLLYPDGTIQHGGIFLREDQLDRVPLVASHDHAGKPGNDPEASRSAELMAVTAAAMLLRREAFDAAHSFDEGFYNGYEDVDLCLKVRRAGWKIVYEPACTLIHHESKSGSKRFAKRKENQRRFLERWVGQVHPEVLVSPYLEVGKHPEWNARRPFPKSPPAFDPKKGSVRIYVLEDGNAANLAITLASVFASRIGLYDSIVVPASPEHGDVVNYLKLCGGYDDAMRWSACSENVFEFLRRDLQGTSEEFVVFLRPGAVATQGWLARLLRWAAQPQFGMIGPMLSGVSGAQDALGLLKSGHTGAFFPNEIAHAFAQGFREQGSQVPRLHDHCVAMRTADLVAALDTGAQTFEEMQSRCMAPQIVAHDVFVHLEQRYAPHAAAA